VRRIKAEVKDFSYILYEHCLISGCKDNVCQQQQQQQHGTSDCCG